MRRALPFLTIVLMSCQEYATFTANEDLEIKARPARQRDAKNETVGTLKSGTRVVGAPVVRGMDFRYYEVRLDDGGTGYVRGGGSQMTVE